MDEAKEKLKFLVAEIKSSFESSDQRRQGYKKKAFSGYMSTAVLAAITTLILGIKFDDNFCCNSDLETGVCAKDIALFLSSLIVVINAFNGFYNHKELWIANNNTRNAFRKLLFDIDYARTGEPSLTLEQVNLWRQEYQDIIDGMNSTWDKFRADKK